MQWQGRRQSSNIEDRRGSPVRRGIVGGGLGTIVLLLLAVFFGFDPSNIMDQNTFDTVGTNPEASSPADENTKQFVATVLGYTEDTWTNIFHSMGRTYTEPRLVLFTGAVESACGFGQAAMGPFYCPSDQKVYLDTSFFQELSQRFKAPGDFAQAYVIAHEVGHHVQNLFGISSQVESFRRQSSSAEANEASVRLELQADCLAGVWAARTEQTETSQLRDFLETGDVEEALRAASMIGDDRLQMQQQGYVVPESFTHGTAEQRLHWFRQGFESGNVSQCNTFEARKL